MPERGLHILMIEDQLALQRGVAALFEAQGHRVDFAGSGRSGLVLALNESPDVVVLDLGLPDMDGLEVCRQLRERADRHLPVLMLTARDGLDDKLRGFAHGADDYLVKPFAGQELLARCLALAQRHRLGGSHVLQIGPLRIDRRDGSVHRDGQRIELQQTGYRILLHLAEAWPRAVTRSALIAHLWPEDVPPSDPLRTHLYLLRQALDRPFDRPMLRTVHGVGLRLDAEA